MKTYLLNLTEPKVVRRFIASSDKVALTRYFPVFSINGKSHFLVLLILVLFPFQRIGLDIGTSKFDLSNLIFYLFSFMLLLNLRKIELSKAFKLFLLIYLTIEGIMLVAGPAPLLRFSSAFVCLTSILFVFGSRNSVPVNAKLAFRMVMIGVTLVAASILFGHFLQGDDRPAGVMAEPSVAGLILLGATAGLLLSSRWAATRAAARLSIIGGGLLFGVSFLTKTTHVLSFVIALTSLGLLSRSFNLRTVILGVAGIAVLYWLFTYDPHYHSRVDVQGAASNLSLLSWLQGFDQMVDSFQLYPLVGAGLGGTGQFDFYSPYSAELAFLGLSELNRQDAFSGLFRLMIELGPVLMALVLWGIGSRLFQLWRATGNGLLPVCRESQAQVFLFSFAFTLVIGLLLKEPTYSRSHFVLGALLFSIVPLRAVVDVPLSVTQRLADGSR